MKASIAEVNVTSPDRLQPSLPHKPVRLQLVALWQLLPKGCSPGTLVPFFRSSSDTCRRLFPILSAISVSVLWAYIPASIATRSDNVIRLIFSCFPQAVTETIISLIAEVNITLCPLFYPLNVTFTFAINPPVGCSISYSVSNKAD